MRVFMTGATGFLGREVLVRLLAAGRRVLVLTRPRPDEDLSAAHHRLAQVVERTAPGTPLDALTVVHGDVTVPELGLSIEAERWLSSSTEPVQVLHGAAEVRFDLPWEVMEAQNVGGTLHVARFARRLLEEGRLFRLDHVSTTFVAGDRVDVVPEEDVDVGQRPRNDYERSKLAAEVALRAEHPLPLAVHRPSIIVGDSRSGRASSFKVLYWPMKVYARGRWRTMFGRPDCTVDVVPVDYVADALVHLMSRSEAVGRTFHLAAGPERQASIGELAAIVERVFAKGGVRYVDPDLYMRWLRPVLLPVLRWLRPDVAERGGVYLPYFKSNPSFAVGGAEALLLQAGLRAPDVRDYFERIVRFAADSNFGQRLPSEPSS